MHKIVIINQLNQNWIDC